MTVASSNAVVVVLAVIQHSAHMQVRTCPGTSKENLMDLIGYTVQGCAFILLLIGTGAAFSVICEKED